MCDEGDRAKCGVFALVKMMLTDRTLTVDDVVDLYEEIEENLD